MFKKLLSSLLLSVLFSQNVFAATYWVDTNADNDPNTCVAGEQTNDDDCTFRDAVSQALTSGDVIRFMDNENQTITFGGSAYALSANGITVDAVTGTSHIVAIDGNNSSIDGFDITGDDIIVKGFYLYNFTSASAINVAGAANATTLDQNVIGLQTDGTTMDANLRGIATAGTNTTISNSTISGNSNYGIYVKAGTKDTVIKGNKIGTNTAGTADKGNSNFGIFITGQGGAMNMNGGDGGVEGIYIGGDEAAERNIISGNDSGGISVGSASDNIDGNLYVQGNYIGTDVNGSTALGNSGNGGILSETSGVDLADLVWTIGTNGDGTNDSAEGNVISNNTGSGISINNSAGGTLKISGNKIGFAADGTTAMGNSNCGIVAGGTTLTIGSDLNGTGDTNEGNVIGNNTNCGLDIYGSVMGTVKIHGNKIGVNQNGTGSNGNGQKGININDTSSNATTLNIGGYSSAGAAYGQNIIGNHTGDGINILSMGPGSTLTIQNNYIGFQGNGTTAAANSGDGIEVADSGGTITLLIGTNGDGTNDTSEGNLIGNNGAMGVNVGVGIGTLTIAGNTIKSNTSNGIEVNGTGFTAAIMIGGDDVANAERNVIGSNGGAGMNIQDTGSTAQNVTIQNNYIGVDSNGTTAIGNASSGITVLEAAALLIKDNVVSNNSTSVDAPAVSIGEGGSGVSTVAIYGNKIGTKADGVTAAGNRGYGVRIHQATITSVIIGGATAALGNVIAANGDGVGDAEVGLSISRLASTSTPITIKGNYIGIGSDGTTTTGMGNRNNGIDIQYGSPVIGGDNDLANGNLGEGNVISNNGAAGIEIVDNGGLGGATIGAATIYGNIIGLKKGVGGSYNADAGNTTKGIWITPRISTVMSSLTLGGIGSTVVSSKRNVISGNEGGGVVIGGGINFATGFTASIINNYIGTDWAGTAAVGNTGIGLVLYDIGDRNINIGDGTANGRNVMSGNTGGASAVGLQIEGGNVTVKGNYIGVGSDGTTVLQNAGNSILANNNGSVTGLLIGGSGTNANTISNNVANGIEFEDVTASNEATLDTDNTWTVTTNPTYSFWQRYMNNILTTYGPKECYDGIDNDSNGATDYPADSGCSGYTDSDESTASAGGPASVGVGSNNNNDDGGDEGGDDEGGDDDEVSDEPSEDQPSDETSESDDTSTDETTGPDETTGEATTEAGADTQSIQDQLNNAVSTTINIITGGGLDETTFSGDNVVNNIQEYINSYQTQQETTATPQLTNQQETIISTLLNIEEGEDNETVLNNAAEIATETLQESLNQTVTSSGGTATLEVFGETVVADQGTEVEFYWTVEEARQAHYDNTKQGETNKIVYHPSTDSNKDGIADILATLGNKNFLANTDVSLNDQFYFDGHLYNTYKTKQEMLPKVPRITNLNNQFNIDELLTVGPKVILWLGGRNVGEEIDVFLVDPETLQEYHVGEIELDTRNRAGYLIDFMEAIEDFGTEKRNMYIVVQNEKGEGSMEEVIVDPQLELKARSIHLVKGKVISIDEFEDLKTKQEEPEKFTENLYTTVLLASEPKADDDPYILAGYGEPGSYVYVTWKSLTYSSVVLADASQGYFEIEAPEELEDGEHEIITYVYQPGNSLVSNISQLVFSK